MIAYEKETEFGTCFLCGSPCYFIRCLRVITDYLWDIRFIYKMEFNE
ncbi:hypothetical protein GCM10010912_62460 [Paenibacillus albidus]|uniref:Uncharacterized protein n=1 Tax=Paenibacillus albidus TaxID=2041023 RepID=A0A917D3H2_9BACL|nr:hypothetical protein GCM10010912_62460 [Paenibacillus albidus]